MRMSSKGLSFLKDLEGLKLSPYLDTRGIPTIGVGSTYYEDNTPVKITDHPITKERALQLLSFHIKKFEDGINSLVKVKLNQNQFDALTSFAYNVGLGAFSKSTLLKLLNSGKYTEAANEFLSWTKQKELTGRRMKEKELFLSTSFTIPSNEDINDKLSKIENTILKS